MRAEHPGLVLLTGIALIAIACGSGSSPAQDGRSGEPNFIVAPDDAIAFGARAAGSGQYGLYLVRADGSELQKLADEAGYIFFPRWSPSGDRIAYIVGTEGEEGAGTLRLYDLRTGRTATVSEEALPSLHGPATSWSPDGTRLAFADAVGIRIYDVDRGEVGALPEISGATPDWSPDGERLVFVSPAGDEAAADLFLMDSDGEDPRRLAERSGVERNPRWSPDGERVLFSSASAGQPEGSDLLAVDRDGRGLTEVGPGSDAVWSPDGERIVYSAPAADNAANRELFLVTLGGGEPRPLGPETTVTRDSWPAWSPDGGLVAFVALVDPRTAFLCVAQLEPLDRDCLDLPDLAPGAPAWRP